MFEDLFNNFLYITYDILNFVVSSLLDVTDMFFKLTFGWVNLPDVPNTIRVYLYDFEDLIFDNLSLFAFFIEPRGFIIIFDLFIHLFVFKYVAIFVLAIVRTIRSLFSGLTGSLLRKAI